MESFKCGEFELKIYGTRSVVNGPAVYLATGRCDEILAACAKKQNAVFEYAVGEGHHPAQALLVAVQTDYAAWLGMARFNAARRGEGAV